MMQTAEIETARPVMTMKFFWLHRNFSSKHFSLKSAYGRAQSVISMKRI